MSCELKRVSISSGGQVLSGEVSRGCLTSSRLYDMLMEQDKYLCVVHATMMVMYRARFAARALSVSTGELQLSKLAF